MKSIFTLLLLLGLSIGGFAQFAGNNLHFDGQDDYVAAPVPSYISDLDNQDLTVTAWINTDSIGFQRVFFAQADVDNFVCMAVGPNGNIIYYLNSFGNNYSIESMGTVTAQTWHHLALSWDASTTTLTGFIDGVEQTLNPGVFVSTTGTDGILSIGARTDGAQTFVGNIDALTFWGKASSPCEIQRHLSATVDGSEANLLDAFKLDEGNAGGSNPTETTAANTGNAAIAGTLINFALNGSTSNWIASTANITHNYNDWDTVFQAAVTLNAGIGNATGVSLQWIDCATNTPVAGATDASFFPPAPGNYAVILSFADCEDTTACYPWLSNGANELTLADLQLAPNPGRDQLTISLPHAETTTVSIFNMTGQKVMEQRFTNQNQLQLNTQELANDIYLVSVMTPQGVLSKRWVKH